MPFDRVIQRETHELGVQPAARVQDGVAGLGFGGDPRQALVGLVDRQQGGIDGLEILDHRLDAIGGGRAVDQPCAALQVGDGGGVQAPGKILVVIPVADLGELRVQRQAPIQQTLMRKIDQLAGFAGDLVGGQDLEVALTLVVLQQVAEGGAQLHAATGHHPWRHGGVQIRRQVEVHRPAQVHAGAVGFAQGGEQQAGAPPVVDRELEPGHVDDGHAGEAQPGVAGAAQAGLVIQLDLAGFDLPCIITGRAGGIGHLLHLRLAVTLHREAFRGAARGAGNQGEIGVMELAGVGAQVKFGLLAAYDQVAVAEQRFLLDQDLALVLVVGKRLSRKQLVAAGQPYRTAEFADAVTFQSRAVGLHHQFVAGPRLQVSGKTHLRAAEHLYLGVAVLGAADRCGGQRGQGSRRNCAVQKFHLGFRSGDGYSAGP